MNKLSLTQKLLAHSSILVAAVALPLFQISAVSASNVSPISAPISAPDNGNSNSGSNSGGSSDNGGNGGSSAPSCNAEKPKAPYLVSWGKTGANQVTLHWSKPQSNVNYYSVSFGLKSHSPLYGDPHVGNGDSTSTVINGLSGQQTYYFTVEAGNDCVHSDPSNEVIVKINGAKLNTPFQGYTQKGVLSAKTFAPKTQNTQVDQPIQTHTQPSQPQNGSFLTVISNFFGNFFRH